jgi:hypothetical protein
MRLLVSILLLSWHFCLFANDVETLRSEASQAAVDGNTTLAIERLQDLLELAPDDGAAHYQLGTLLMDNGGDLDQAIAQFIRAGELGIQPQGVGYRLARIYARTGREPEALDQLEMIASAGFGMFSLVENQPDFASLENNPRFVAALQSIRANRYPCENDLRFHAFDFWVGEWNVTTAGQQAGTNNITSILGRCLIFEQWTNVAGGEGKSFNYYDPAFDHWRQIWISDSGSIIEFTGQARDGGIFYTAETINPQDGSVTYHKFEFTQNGDGSVRQHWQTSSDAGETWATIWDARYERISGSW